MATIDENILQTYYDTRNFAAAADYLRTATAKDYRSQQKLNAHIRQLERDAAMQESYLRDLDAEQKEAYVFMQGLNGDGAIPRNRIVKTKDTEIKELNRYGTNYLNNINSLRANDGTSLSNIAININSDDDLEMLSSALGYDNINSNDIGLRYQALGDGKHRLVVSRNNKNLYKVLNAVDDVSSRQASDALTSIATAALAGSMLGAGAGTIVPAIGNIIGAIAGGVTGVLAASVNEIELAIRNSNRFDIYGVDSNGKLYSTSDFNYGNLQAAMEEVNKANKIYSKINENKEREQTFTTELEVTQFLGAGHAEAFKALKQGKIDQTTYDKIVETWQDGYDRLVTNADFTKHEVYAWSLDSGEGVNLTKVDNANVPDLKGEVLLAMKEGRLSKALSIKDGEIGTLLTIKPKTDKSGDWSKAKGEVQKQIFIQGLFDGTAEQAFEADTKSKAARQNADMKRWNYEQKLASGVTVGYSGGIPYTKVPDNNGNITIVPIAEEDMLRSLNEAVILDSSVSEVLANLDENGELPYQTVNGRRVRPTVESMLTTYSIAATNEMLPKGSTTERERLQYQNNLYNAMRALYERYYKLQHS